MPEAEHLKTENIHKQPFLRYCLLCLQKIPAWLRAIIAGLCVAASVPPWGWWPLGFVGFAFWTELFVARPFPPRWWHRVGLSTLAAIAWFAPSTVWMIDFTVIGWIIAVAYFALIHGCAAIFVPATQQRYIVLPAAFVLAELLRWNWPFGGLPLATVSMGQVASPLANTARLGGSILLTGLTVAVGGILAMAVSGRLKPALLATAGITAVTIAATHSPRSMPVMSSAKSQLPATIRVAAVQGGGPQNTRADICTRRDVFERHFEATQTLVMPTVDLILWPEGAANLSAAGAIPPPSHARCNNLPLLKAEETRERLLGLAEEKTAVMVVGLFERAADGKSNLNYAVAYDPFGTVSDAYHKHRIVPFGEYVPLRSWLERFNEELPQRDVKAGDAATPAVVETPLGTLGVSISWEIFFDHRVRNSVMNGAEILLNPTNGSSYWLTVVQSQQIAVSRLRALETDRWIIQASPTGLSAIINPHGRILSRSDVSERAVLQASVEARTGKTLAVRLGPQPTAWTAILIILFTCITSRITKQSRKGDDPQTRDARKQAGKQKSTDPPPTLREDIAH
ncbi:MAG: apolipoprotein N-acyltransferase [Acidimicrobiaceae bacterium]|nr:apolipoprotein N-acyltransferase [Acidimicrobiaceae bacterium]